MRLLPLAALASVACATTPPPTALDEAPPAIVSAFFGLDDEMPDNSFWLCTSGPGADGMPVTFTRRAVDDTPPEAFAVRTRSGAVHTPSCATTRPANESSENHTILLVGSFGDASDPPVEVEVVGDLALAGDANARGLRAAVTPLQEGPTLVLALPYLPDELDTDCPSSTRRVLMVVWAGGVTPAPGRNQEDHRRGYRVATGEAAVEPFALGDLDDQDNYVHLCLDTDTAPQEVSFEPDLLVDPRGDANPATSLAVTKRD